MLTTSDSLPGTVAHLRAIALPITDHRIIAFGVDALDNRLGCGGLRAGALHEVAARSCSFVDDAAATLFLAGIAAREAGAVGGPVLWASGRNDLYAPGLEQAGLAAADVIYAQRRTVMSASMIGMKGRVQKEGEVIHVICDRIVDHGALLTQVGAMSFPHRTGRGDGARHAGSPDRGDAGYKQGGWSPAPRSCYWPPHADGMDPEDVVRFKSHDFR